MFTQLIIITDCRENGSVRVAVLVKFCLRLYEQIRCAPLAQREYCKSPGLDSDMNAFSGNYYRPGPNTEHKPSTATTTGCCMHKPDRYEIPKAHGTEYQNMLLLD